MMDTSREQITKRNDNGVHSRSEIVRRSAAERKRRKRKKDFFTFFVLILFIIAVCIVLSLTVFFKTAVIAVDNIDGRYTNEQIQAVSGITVGNNMFRLNLGSIEDKIEIQLPYVGEAQIKRNLPDTIVIAIKYTSVSMAVKNGGTYVLLNSSGKVLEDNVSELPENAAVITGAEITEYRIGEKIQFNDENILDYSIRLAGFFEEYGMSNITGYDFSNPSSVSVEVDSRIVVLLGTMANAEGKLAFGKEVIEKCLSTYSPEIGKVIVDLTDEKTAYVRIQANIDAAEQASSESQASEPETAQPSEETSSSSEHETVTEVSQ